MAGTTKELAPLIMIPPPDPAYISELNAVLADTFELEDYLGSGAMGVVYRARQKRPRRTVALKFPSPKYQKDPKFLGRFAREAGSMALLEHPNVVQIFDVYLPPSNPLEGECPVPYLVMEYVEGAALEEFLARKEKSLTVGAVMGLLRQVASGLDAAHAAGVVHRDIKPSNIIVTLPQQTAKIMDFGVAKVDEAGSTASESSNTIAVGTPAFMAPETLRETGVITPAVDIYALGVTVYRLLTRSLPFTTRQSRAKLHYAHLKEAPDRPTSRNPVLPRSVDAVILAALDKNPEKRQATATAFVESLESALGPVVRWKWTDLFTEKAPDEELLAAVDERVRAARRWRLRAFGVAMLGVVVLGTIVWLGYLQWRNRPPSREPRVLFEDMELPSLVTAGSSRSTLVRLVERELLRPLEGGSAERVMEKLGSVEGDGAEALAALLSSGATKTLSVEEVGPAAETEGTIIQELRLLIGGETLDLRVEAVQEDINVYRLVRMERAAPAEE